jgi:hypothetical protein
MYWYRDIVTECVVIEDINSEEEHNIDQPAAYWNAVGLEE